MVLVFVCQNLELPTLTNMKVHCTALNSMSLYNASDKPGPPRNLRIKEVNKDYLVIAWDAPESDGGERITGYTIEKRDARKTNYISSGSVDGDSLEFKVTKLIEGNEYYVRVSSENKIGQSEPAETSEPVKARLPFGRLW